MGLQFKRGPKQYVRPITIYSPTQVEIRFTANGARVCRVYDIREENLIIQTYSEKVMDGLLNTTEDREDMPIHLELRGMEETKDFITRLNGVIRRPVFTITDWRVAPPK